MTTLPKKPDDIAHVSDALWLAALDHVAKLHKYDKFPEERCTFWYFQQGWNAIIDHARLLIKQGEIEEPGDMLDKAIKRFYETIDGLPMSFSGFSACIRKHFSGLTFPEYSE